VGWSPATSRYVDRIRTLAGVDPTLLVAHAYTRYLGDLSGGQVMAKAVKKHLDVKGPAGVAFYEFPAIADIPEFKGDYRRCLDALPLDTTDKLRVVEEACRVFRLNRALADELWSERE
jgi:heme oxygenase